MRAGILLSGSADVDFMIHGIVKYSFFGHEVWITTTHVCLLIVMLVLIGFSIAAGRVMKRAWAGALPGFTIMWAPYSSLSCFPIYRGFWGCALPRRITG